MQSCFIKNSNKSRETENEIKNETNLTHVKVIRCQRDTNQIKPLKMLVTRARET